MSRTLGDLCDCDFMATECGDWCPLLDVDDQDVMDVDDRPRCELDYQDGVCQAVLLPNGTCPHHGDGGEPEEPST